MHPFRADGVPYCGRHLADGADDCLECFVVDIENIAEVLFWNDERVSGSDGTVVEKGERGVILVDNLRGNFTAYDF